jgi:hypothetical protein
VSKLRRVLLLAVVASVVTGCSTQSTSRPAKSTAATSHPSFVVPTTSSAFNNEAIAQGAKVFNYLFGFNLGPVSHQIAVVESYHQIETPLKTELSALSKAGAIGASVNSVSVGSRATCSSAGVSYPCVKVAYSVVGHKGSITSNQVGYAVMRKGTWVVSRKSACTIAPPGTKKAWSKPNC